MSKKVVNIPYHWSASPEYTYPRPYVIKYLAPVEISYYFDSVKGMTLDFPMRFGNDSFTFAYKHEGIHVVLLKPLRR